MADKYTDSPKNKGITGVRNGIATYCNDVKEGASKTARDGNPVIVLGGFAAFISASIAGGSFLTNLVSDAGLDYIVPGDEAIVEGLQNQHGYVAVSNNDGQTGYVLLRDGEDYELYRFSAALEDGAFELSYEPQNDDAWAVMRSVQQHYDTLIKAATDSEVMMPENPYSMFVFDSISKPYELEGQIMRLAEGMSELNVFNIAENMDDQRGAWGNAALDVYQNAQYGFEAGEFEAEKASLETKAVRDFSFSAKMLTVAAGGLVTMAFGAVGGSFVHAGRRRRERKSELKR